MIVLDTNVVSELWRPVPSSVVRVWIDAQLVESLYLTAITVAELRFGIATMADGRRRAVYQDRLEREVLPAFNGRILPFDIKASHSYAEIMSSARRNGRTIANADGYIAAAVHSAGMMIATRDVKPFQDAGLTVINPWEIQ